MCTDLGIVEHPTPRTSLGLLWYISLGNLAEHNSIVYKSY